MIRRILTCLALGAALLLASAPARAQTVTIKLGTLAPDGSVWHRLLKQMGEDWSKASNGRVKLKIYAGGVAGNESDMIRKLRVGQLQAAALTAIGLQDIDSSPQAVATPGLITTEDEWKYVFEKMQPVWTPRVLARGFVPLMWGDTGWVYFYFTRPIKTAAQAQGAKMFAWAGDPAAVKAWQAAGFQPIVLSATDISTALNTGMIEGVANTPVMSFTARFFEKANYMPDVAWGHLPGATVVSKATWDKVPADVRPELERISRDYADRVNTEAQRMDNEALEQMKKAGLQVLALTPAERQAWIAMAEKTWPVIRGGVVSNQAFDEVKKVRDEYRATKAASK